MIDLMNSMMKHAKAIHALQCKCDPDSWTNDQRKICDDYLDDNGYCGRCEHDAACHASTEPKEQEECDNPITVRDPFGTGDRHYTEIECGCGKCD